HALSAISWLLCPSQASRADPAEISCVTLGAVASSQANEPIRAFKKSRARICCSLRFRGIPLGARPECVSAIPPALPQGCWSRRAQLRGDDDHIGQLRACCSIAIGGRTCYGGSVFENSGVDLTLGSIAVSLRVHFRACAACARLAR